MSPRLTSRGRALLAASALVWALALLPSRTATAADDPKLLWLTMETESFRIHYPSGLAHVASHVARVAESVQSRLSPVLGWKPSSKTELALTDRTDSANGFATALPYNAITLFVTPPDDMSPLGDVDDWYLELITHEFTHVLHTDHMRGLPAILNAVLGKTYAPNQTQPRWILEGLAVLIESEYTTGGRLRSSQWNMFMRTDVLENNLARLDEVSNGPRRWPYGNIWYLYGSYFMRWIRDTYGMDAIRQMIDDYGKNIIPYGVQRSIKRATGRTFDELYGAWLATLKDEVQVEKRRVTARGLREGTRLTTGGNGAQKPRFIPDTTWKGRAGEILYYRDDEHDTAGLYAVPLVRDDRGVVTGSREAERRLLVRTAGVSSPSFAPDGTLYFNSIDSHRRIFSFYDLFRMGPDTTSERGLDGRRRRLSDGFRAVDVDVSPDGRRIVFVTNTGGTMYLQIGDVGPAGLSAVRPLMPSEPFDQAFSPRWSPDGKRVAVSRFRGGFRDIYVIDVASGNVERITSDRAIDSGPSFSPDGRYLLFHSDRTGINNIYAHDLRTGALAQVTNVLTGAFQPELSPDGKTLVYVGYTKRGYDLFAMEFREDRFLPATVGVKTYPKVPASPKPVATTVRDYNPLSTLWPRRYSLAVQPGNFGQALSVTVAGSDITSQHSFSATLTTEIDEPSPQVSASYTYGRLPVDLTFSAYRSLAPRAELAFGSYRPTYVEQALGFDTAVSYGRPTAFDSQSLALSYSVAQSSADLPMSRDAINPYDTPTIPRSNLITSLNLGWSYSNAESFYRSIGPEKGFRTGVSASVSHPYLGGQYTGYAVAFDVTSYHRMPWHKHHSLALHVGGGTGGGNLGGRGLFYVGGFLDLPVIDTVRKLLIQGGFPLRGYAPVAMAGRNYALFNAEYRFPIVDIDRGLSTFPAYLSHLAGSVFVDYGTAFDVANDARFKLGVGGELWLFANLGYFLPFTFRFGYAKGMMSEGLDKLYLAATVPF